ncbi:hypothetical protein SBA3_3140025 [Candidatus Sulfopaludibacter sp. SbA3]|nr:hypothetical protein SBA3_3140025 [Candidatus Sulfopaludibacter sp. SbA3]
MAQFEALLGGAGQGAATGVAGELLVSNERWITNNDIDRPHPLRAGHKEVCRQEIRGRDAILAQLFAYVAVYSRVDFNAKHLCGWIPTHRSQAFASGPEENAASKGGV